MRLQLQQSGGFPEFLSSMILGFLLISGTLLKIALFYIAWFLCIRNRERGEIPGYEKSLGSALPLPLGVSTANVQKCNLLPFLIFI